MGSRAAHIPQRPQHGRPATTPPTGTNYRYARARDAPAPEWLEQLHVIAGAFDGELACGHQRFEILEIVAAVTLGIVERCIGPFHAIAWHVCFIDARVTEADRHTTDLGKYMRFD